MTSYESMRRKLAPLGVYRLDSGSVTDCELKAYAAGLEPLFDKLEEMEREAFIPTAASYGLCLRERFLERERPELPVQERRERLLAMEQTRSADATAAGFRQYLSDCGLEDFSVTEYPTRQRLTVAVDDDLTAGEKKLLEKKLLRVMPAHLNVMVYYHDGTSVTL